MFVQIQRQVNLTRCECPFVQYSRITKDDEDTSYTYTNNSNNKSGLSYIQLRRKGPRSK